MKNAIPLTLGIRKGYPLSQFPFNIAFEVIDSAIKQGEKEKRNTVWKGRNKTHPYLKII